MFGNNLMQPEDEDFKNCGSSSEDTKTTASMNEEMD